MATPPETTRTWTRHVNEVVYTCSTDGGRVHLDALGAAFASDALWWATALPPAALRQVVENSLCFGVYLPNEGTPPLLTPPTPPQS